MSTWIKSYTTRPGHPKVVRMMAITGWTVQEVLGSLDCLYYWVANYAEDGILEKFDAETIGFAATQNKSTALSFYKAAIDARLIEENPRRIHAWLKYFWAFLKNKYRKERIERLDEIKSIWTKIEAESMNGSAKPSAKPKAAPKPPAPPPPPAPKEPPKEKIPDPLIDPEGKAPPKHEPPWPTNAPESKDDETMGPAEPDPLLGKSKTLQGVAAGKTATEAVAERDKPNPKPKKKRKKSDQQLVLERFAKIRGLDFTTPAAQKLICRPNGAAAKELVEVTRGDLSLAFFFMDMAHEQMLEQLKAFSEKSGEKKEYKHLSALVKQWPEFGPAWEEMADDDKKERLEEYPEQIAALR